MQPTWIAVPKVAQEIHFHLPFRKEILIAPETRRAGGKELLVHLGVIETRHGPAVETDRARGHDQVGALQAGVRFAVISTGTSFGAWAITARPRGRWRPT